MILSFLIALLALLTPGASGDSRLPMHIPTWAFDEFNGQGAGASASDVQRYVSFAEGGLGNDKALRDCHGAGGCSSVFYFNPNLVYDSPQCPYAAYAAFLANAREDWFVHEAGFNDAAHRVHGVYAQTCKGERVQINVYVANHTNPAVVAFFRAYLQQSADGWDAYEMDDLSDSLLTQFYGPGGGFCRSRGGNNWCDGTAEIRSDTDLSRVHRSFAGALVHRNGRPMVFYYNGLAFTQRNPAIPPLLGNGPFRGVICENCIVNNGLVRRDMFAKVLGAMARIDRIPDAAFVELNTGKAPAGSEDQLRQREVTTAIAWLGFAPDHTIVWPDLQFDTRGLAVWPEDTVYPSEPLQTMRNGADDLAIAPGVWRREFARCAERGREIGPCAAVLNGSNAPVVVSGASFTGRYDSVLHPSGGDVLSGGSLEREPFARITLAPGSAALVGR